MPDNKNASGSGITMLNFLPYTIRGLIASLLLGLNVLGEKFHSLLNITIVYPDGIPTFWKFLCGRVTRVMVRLQTKEIPEKFRQGDYAGDPVFREAFHQWVQQVWREKDRMMQSLIKEAGA
jgi:hypothetical protein